MQKQIWFVSLHWTAQPQNHCGGDQKNAQLNILRLEVCEPASLAHEPPYDGHQKFLLGSFRNRPSSLIAGNVLRLL
jgi:hypothetical protein